MIPGMNPRQMRQAMKRMGIKQEELDDAIEVIIRCSDREIVISNPNVAKVNMMGNESWQITGEASERGLETAPEVTDDDVKTVMEQAGVDEHKAKAALEETGGDLAAAIMKLNG